MYHFVAATPVDKQQRRVLLDRYAMLAQFSALIPLLLLQLRFILRAVIRSWRARTAADIEAPSSPFTKKASWGAPSSGFLGQYDWSAAWRRAIWWAEERLEIPFLGTATRGQHLASAVWTAWLVILSFAETGEDYFHLTKRFGIVAGSQMPLQYMLAMKAPWSPLQMLTRSSHETLNVAHQLLGRIVTLLGWLHALLYLNYYIQTEVLGSKLMKLFIVCGIFAILAFTALLTTSLEPLRRRSYRLFYIVHVLLAALLLPALWLHVRHIRIYLYETALVYAGDALLRFLSTRHVAATIRAVPGTDLVEVRIPVTGAALTAWRGRWQPGQHAYLSLPGHPLARTFRSNPFTVASLPTIDGELLFVARVLDGNTAALAQRASSTVSQLQSIAVEGPYGIPSHPERLLGFDRVLLIAGGVGATFTAPLYRQLLADLSPSPGSARRQRVAMVWAARSRADVQWALPAGPRDRAAFLERLSVCVSREALAGVPPSSSALRGENASPGKVGETDEGMELEEYGALLEGDEKRASGARRDGHGLAVFAGRLDVMRIVDRTFAHGDAERVAVVCCGPQGLNRRVRTEVGRWVARGRDVWLWEERFSF